jgi:hypothetical protein
MTSQEVRNGQSEAVLRRTTHHTPSRRSPRRSPQEAKVEGLISHFHRHTRAANGRFGVVPPPYTGIDSIGLRALTGRSSAFH